jgi:hypothetical protein
MQTIFKYEKHTHELFIMENSEQKNDNDRLHFCLLNFLNDIICFLEISNRETFISNMGM